jgi:hypothetical protein
MKVSSLDRREFVSGMLVLGLTACAGPRLARRTLRSSPDPGAGPFLEEMIRLADDLARGALGPRGYARRAGDRLMDLELEPDVLESWVAQGPDFPEIGGNGIRVLDTHPLSFGGRPGQAKAVLFYTPAGVTNPPHEHHNLISCKRVLKGSYHVRQYQRLRQIEPGVLAIRQVTELPRVDFHGPYVAMTDDQLNVHWFGANDQPVLALNLVVENALPPGSTFHGSSETRPVGRYFVDPTAAPGEDGSIRAPAVDRDRAEELAARPLRDFPSRLPGRATS